MIGEELLTWHLHKNKKRKSDLASVEESKDSVRVVKRERECVSSLYK